jgi:hypothetical protein
VKGLIENCSTVFVFFLLFLITWGIARFLQKSLMQPETKMAKQQEREGGEFSYQKASHEKSRETYQETRSEGFP